MVKSKIYQLGERVRNFAPVDSVSHPERYRIAVPTGLELQAHGCLEAGEIGIEYNRRTRTLTAVFGIEDEVEAEHNMFLHNHGREPFFPSWNDSNRCSWHKVGTEYISNSKGIAQIKYYFDAVRETNDLVVEQNLISQATRAARSERDNQFREVHYEEPTIISGLPMPTKRGCKTVPGSYSAVIIPWDYFCAAYRPEGFRDFFNRRRNWKNWKKLITIFQ